MRISYKIANQLKKHEGRIKTKLREFVRDVAVDIGCSILNPEYLIEIGRWEDNREGKLVACDDSVYMMKIQNLISNSNNLMNNREKSTFGEKIALIEKLFLCDDCFHEAA